MLHKWVTWVGVLLVLGGAFLAWEVSGGREDQPEPTDAMRQRDLLMSRLKIGDVRLRQGDIERALDAHRECLAIAERGAAQDPTNVTWQRDLAIIHFRLSFGMKEAGAIDEAREHAMACVTIYGSLAELDPAWRDEMAEMQVYLAELSEKKD